MYTSNEFYKKFPESKKKLSIVTLGKDVTATTCSVLVARKAFPDFRLKGCESFEEGAYLVEKNKIDYLLVPAAYPKLNDILMRTDLILHDIFKYDIPQIVLILDKDKNEQFSRDKLFFHPATRSLIETIDGYHFRELEPVGSNDVSVTKLLDEPNSRCSGAITNQVAAEKAGYGVTQVLRPAIPMGWLVFRAIMAGDLGEKS